MKDENETAHEESKMPVSHEEPLESKLEEEGELADDPQRLKVLEELYSTLESELEGDLDQESSPRH